MSDSTPATGTNQGAALTDDEREALRFAFIHYRAEYDEGSNAYTVVERIVAAHLGCQRCGQGR